MSQRMEDSRGEETPEHCSHCSEHEGDDEQQREGEEEERDDDEQEDTEKERSHASLPEDIEYPMEEDNSF